MASESVAETRPAERLPQSIPDHVPPHLVHDISKYTVANELEDPFSLTKTIYDDLPRIFFSSARSAALFDGVWVVTRYEDCREVYQNDKLYSTADAAAFQRLVGETFRMIPLAVDPPEHGKYRILLNPWFSPKAINALEASIRATVNELIDEFVDTGRADLSYDFGRIYPVRVFMTLMGFDPARFEDFLAWEYAILHSDGDISKMQWGMGSALKYLRSYIAEVTETPADNLTSHIVHGQIEGRPLTDDEIIGTVAFLWLGGLDTVAATTSLMLRRLALDPAMQQTLRDDPAIIPDAIEEFLRVQPLVNSSRLVKEDHEFHGAFIKKGDHIMAYNSAGNFDPAEFSNPREIRFDRSPNRHFTLAGGPHRCLGSHLARRELKVALEELLRRVPPFRLAPDASRVAQPGLVAVANLPVVWDK